MVFELIGAELPTSFFRRLGIKLEGDWDVRRWLYLAVVSLCVYTLYALKKFPETPYSWPFYHVLPQAGFESVLRAIFRVAFLPFAWLFEAQAYRQILDTPWFQQGYLYSLAYTLLMCGICIDVCPMDVLAFDTAPRRPNSPPMVGS